MWELNYGSNREHTSVPLSYHMVGPVSNGLVSWCRNTLLRVPITEAASLHYQVIDGEVSCRASFVCGSEVFGLTGTRLVLQQPNPDVGHLQLLLTLQSKRIQRLPLWEGSVDHLWIKQKECVLIIPDI